MKERTILYFLVLILLSGSSLLLMGETKRFKAEISGSFIYANPTHLNYLVDTEKQFMSFYLDPVYEEKRENGSLDPLRVFFSVQPRIKYAVTPAFDVSVGLSYLWGIQTSNHSAVFSRSEEWRVVNDELEYRDMTMKISGLIPTVGIHYRFPLSPKEGLEASAVGGPLFASVEYSKNLTQSITNGYDPSIPIWSSERNTSIKGSGNGISLSGSIKYEKKLSRSTGIFFSVGYTHQRVTGIGGAGSETIDGSRTDFNGEWELVEEIVRTNRGETRFLFPTNNWDQLGDKQGDFILNLSGAFLSTGIYVRL